MLIKRRPIITWLLHPDSLKYPNNILLSGVANPINSQILNDQLAELDNIRIQKPIWGLPELLMPSFEEVMNKTILSFEKIMPELFQNLVNKRSVEFYYAKEMLHWFMDSEIINCIYGFS